MFKCTICPFETKYKRCLRNPIRDILEKSEPKGNHDDSKKKTENKEKKYKCGQCSYAAGVKHSLQRHIDGHGPKKTFLCEEGSYKSNDEYCLTYHITRVHKATELFKCE